jgi:hypothetical protein
VIRALRVGAAALAAAAAGCGGGGSPGKAVGGATPAGPCSTAARAAIAGAVRTSPALVTATAFTAPSSAPACRFVGPRAAARPVGVLVASDGAPQASSRFERTVVEYAQTVLWSHEGAGVYPQDIAGLGAGADWFPADHRLLATDGSRLFDITVTWPGQAGGQDRRLAEALARGYVAGR